MYLTDRGTIFATRRFRSTGWLVARYRARSHKRGTLHNRSPELVLAGPSHGRSPQNTKCVSQSSARCGATRQESPSDSPAPRAAENYSMQTLQQSGNGRCAPLQHHTRDTRVPCSSNVFSVFPELLALGWARKNHAGKDNNYNSPRQRSPPPRSAALLSLDLLRDAVALSAEAADARAARFSWRIARKGRRKGGRKGCWWSRCDEEPSGLCGKHSPNCTVCRLPWPCFTNHPVLCNVSSASCAPT